MNIIITNDYITTTTLYIVFICNSSIYIDLFDIIAFAVSFLHGLQAEENKLSFALHYEKRMEALFEEGFLDVSMPLV